MGALFATGQQAGSAVGLGILAVIASSTADSYSAVFAITTALSLVALAVPAYLGLGHRTTRA